MLQYPIDDSPIVKGNQQFNPLLFFVPAMFDMVATTLMYIGLTMTFASSFQMLRGTFVISLFIH